MLYCIIDTLILLIRIVSKSIILIGILGVGMTAVAFVLASPMAEMFVGYDADLKALTVSGFRIFAMSFILMGYAIFASCFFTALNDGVTSAIISFLRTLVFQVAAVVLLPMILPHRAPCWTCSLRLVRCVLALTVKSSRSLPLHSVRISCWQLRCYSTPVIFARVV